MPHLAILAKMSEIMQLVEPDFVILIEMQCNPMIQVWSFSSLDQCWWNHWLPVNHGKQSEFLSLFLCWILLVDISHGVVLNFQQTWFHANYTLKTITWKLTSNCGLWSNCWWCFCAWNVKPWLMPVWKGRGNLLQRWEKEGRLIPKLMLGFTSFHSAIQPCPQHCTY